MRSAHPTTYYLWPTIEDGKIKHGIKMPANGHLPEGKAYGSKYFGHPHVLTLIDLGKSELCYITTILENQKRFFLLGSATLVLTVARASSKWLIIPGNS